MSASQLRLAACTKEPDGAMERSWRNEHVRRTAAMNWDRIKGNWKQFKGQARQQWGKLTDDELDMVEGRREELVGRIQEKYGIARDEAERQVRDWETRL
jgi:uncharacterized protein YjbJ (UPF0337 family)